MSIVALRRYYHKQRQTLVLVCTDVLYNEHQLQGFNNYDILIDYKKTGFSFIKEGNENWRPTTALPVVEGFVHPAVESKFDRLIGKKFQKYPNREIVQLYNYRNADKRLFKSKLKEKLMSKLTRFERNTYEHLFYKVSEKEVCIAEEFSKTKSNTKKPRAVLA